MKGIGIIAMILGHCPIPRLLNSFIFTWHMPLFFIISGFFFHPLKVVDSIKRNFRSLLIPYLVTIVILFLLYILFNDTIFTSITQAFESSIIGAGSRGLPNYQDYYVGALWFLQALFWCKFLYDVIYIYCSDLYRPIFILIISSISTFIGGYLFIPTNLLQGASALIFYEVGYQLYLKKILFLNYNNCLLLFTSLVLVTVSLLSGSMSMVRCFYGFYPVNVLCAISLFILCYQFSALLNNNRTVSNILSYLGRISIVILCVHIIDLFYSFFPLLNDNILHLSGIQERLSRTIWRVLYAIVLSCVLVRIEVISRLFRVAK